MNKKLLQFGGRRQRLALVEKIRNFAGRRCEGGEIPSSHSLTSLEQGEKK
jgi:hypothetical protein